VRGRAGARADRRAALPGALQRAVREVQRALRGGVHRPGALHAGGPPAGPTPSPCATWTRLSRALEFCAWTGCLLGILARMHNAPASRTRASARCGAAGASRAPPRSPQEPRSAASRRREAARVPGSQAARHVPWSQAHSAARAWAEGVPPGHPRAGGAAGARAAPRAAALHAVVQRPPVWRPGGGRAGRHRAVPLRPACGCGGDGRLGRVRLPAGAPGAPARPGSRARRRRAGGVACARGAALKRRATRAPPSAAPRAAPRPAAHRHPAPPAPAPRAARRADAFGARCGGARPPARPTSCRECRELERLWAA
jgi:hypothetical protein